MLPPTPSIVTNTNLSQAVMVVLSPDAKHDAQDNTHFPSSDPEKPVSVPQDIERQSTSPKPKDPTSTLRGQWRTYVRKFVSTNLEERGIKRVQPYERHDTRKLGILQVVLFWVSLNLAAQNITLGMLGPALFELSFRDAALCAVFGAFLGNLPPAYISTFGPRSGNRSLVVARYVMGWWPAKIIVILNLILMLGYALIDAVVAGQILSAVSPNRGMSVVVGIIVVAVICWIVTTFGYSYVHYYERYAWFPQAIVFCILAGTAGPSFNLSNPTQGNQRTRVGNRLTFFSICYAAAATYAGAAADFFVYYPESTKRWKMFAGTLTGLTLTFTFVFVVGVGLGSGIMSNQAWGDAYNSYGQGALLVAGFAPLGTFGNFCAVIAAIGLISNLVPPVYASGVQFQIFGSWFTRMPRVLWNTVGVIIFTVCALAGRAHLAEIFTNFLGLMGYWVSIWLCITLFEAEFFRRSIGFDWECWNDPSRLPLGLAALAAFLIGWVGAVLGM